MCYESDFTGKLAQVKSNWLQISGTDVTECEDYLAAEKKAFDTCSSWFGKEVDTDFHRFELLLEKSPEAVKSAYIQYLSNPENKVTESSVMRMEYADMLTVFQTVWNAAKVSFSVSSRLNVSQAQNQSQSWSACSRNAKAYATETGRQTNSRTAAAVTVSRQSAYGYESQLSGMLRELCVHCAATNNQQGTWIQQCTDEMSRPQDSRQL